MASPGGNKTEKPTPQRLKKAREEGQFLASRGLVGAIQFGIFVCLLPNLIRNWQQQFHTSFLKLVSRAMSGEIGIAEWPMLLRSAISDALIPVLECGGILLAVTAAVHFGITRMGFSVRRLTPKIDRFNPVARLRQLPTQNLKSVVEAAFLLGAVGLAIYSLISTQADTLMRLLLQPVAAGVVTIQSIILALLWKAAAVFLLFGAVDYFQEYQRHMKSLRMSKEEVREENKRAEGDPQLKARIRRLRRDLLRKQMMRDVAKATAVVVNPTHFAVAIRYEVESMPCPIVVAKGRNWLALRIRQIAVENEIPIIENPPLARALYDAVEVGRAISPEFYKAIAEILAYVYKLMGRKLQR